MGLISIPVNTSLLAAATNVGENIVPLANAPVAVTVLLNVFAPPIICELAVNNPGFVTSAAVNVKVVPLKVPPFVLAVEV